MKRIIIITILTFILSLFITHAAIIDDLRHYWSFDINASDDWGTDDGTEVNGVTHNNTNCIISGCYHFNPLDSEYIATPPRVPYTTFTLSIWIYPLSVPFSPGRGVWGYGTSSTNWMGIHIGDIGTTNNSIGYYRPDVPNYANYKTSNETVNKNEWTHIVLMREGMRHVTIYTNGENSTLTVDQSGTDTNFSSSTNGYIGRVLVGGFFFDGFIDEIGYWNRTLTEAEVLELYNNGSAFNPLTITTTTTTTSTTTTTTTTTSTTTTSTTTTTTIIPFTAEMNCTYNTNPYFKEKIPFSDRDLIKWICRFNNLVDKHCYTYIERDGQLVQSNPQREIIKDIGIIDYFEGQTIVNVHFDNKDLVPDYKYNFSVICSQSGLNQTLEVTRELQLERKELQDYTVPRAIWIQSGWTAIILILILIALGFAIWAVVKSGK